MVYVEVAKASDLGVNDKRSIVKSHLGYILKIGDSVSQYVGSFFYFFILYLTLTYTHTGTGLRHEKHSLQ